MPFLFLTFMIFIFVYPLTLKTTKALHVLVEIFFAWSGVDVFIISILAAVLQISQLAESLVGDKCDFILPFLHDYMHDALDGHDKCFVVIAEYKAGAVYLVLAAILIIILGVATIALSGSALADRTNKYFRLIQYSLYQKQLNDGTSETRLIPFQYNQLIKNESGQQHQQQQQQLIDGKAGGIVNTNHKNTSVVKTIQAIITTQHAHNAPIERIPSWFGIINTLARLGIVELTKAQVIEDVFGWAKGGVQELNWDSTEIDNSLIESTLVKSSPPPTPTTKTTTTTSPTSTSRKHKKTEKVLTTNTNGNDLNDDANFVIGRDDYEPSLTTTTNPDYEPSYSAQDPI